MSASEETWLGLHPRAKPLVRAGVLLGLGLGGFFDGIVFHQILQWHHMVSSHPNPSIAGDVRLNVMIDGVFHVVTYLFTVIGIVLLVRAWRTPDVPASGRTLFGSTVLGWGLFNVVEGIVNHQLLGIHHVRPDGPGPVLAWDIGFLIWGLVFVVVGYHLIRGDETAASYTERERPQAEQGESRTERDRVG